MSATLGRTVKMTIFGESHGPAIGLVVDGLPPGLKVETEFLHDELERRALKEVESSLLALRQDSERLRSQRLAADAARQAAQLASLRYGSGLIDFQVVLETQRTALGTQDGLASTATEIDVERVRLFKALGGGWQADAAQPTAASTVTRNPTP